MVFITAMEASEPKELTPYKIQSVLSHLGLDFIINVKNNLYKNCFCNWTTRKPLAFIVYRKIYFPMEFDNIIMENLLII